MTEGDYWVNATGTTQQELALAELELGGVEVFREAL